MNYLISGSSLVLFCLFYQMSGGKDFAPGSESPSAQTEDKVGPDWDFVSYYVPFDRPRIIPAPSTVQVAQNTATPASNIIQVSFTSDNNSESGINSPLEDLRAISGDWVNVRSGPGAQFDVVETVPQGTEVALLRKTDDDWAHVRLLQTDKTAWVAAWLLSD